MNKCLSLYKSIKNPGYSFQARKVLFEGLKVGPTLDFDLPELIFNNDFSNHINHISISGVQIKFSLQLGNNKLCIADFGGKFIFKPIPVGHFRYLDAAPENEHLTMQIAKQVYGIETPPNALVFCKNQDPAYLVKRFDLKDDGSKWLQEDFCQIKQINRQSNGENYKYEGSYEEIAKLIKEKCAAWAIEIERLFGLIIFNYLFSNGDAHLKNFSLIQTKFGDYRLSPAYDLLCTYIHTPSESAMALSLFDNEYYTQPYNILGFYSHADFYEFGLKIGIPKSRVEKTLSKFSKNIGGVEKMINDSFLDENIKSMYWNQYQSRLKAFVYKIG